MNPLSLLTKGFISGTGKIIRNCYYELPLNLEIDHSDNEVNFSIDKLEINLETKKREINVEKISPSIEVNIPIEEIVSETMGG